MILSSVHQIRLKTSLAFIATVTFALKLSGAPSEVSFTQSAHSVEVYDFVELSLNVANPDAGNPFTDVSVSGTFGMTSDRNHWQVAGFCDSPDGTLYRIRFMPPSAGEYEYAVTYKEGSFQKRSVGTFHTIGGGRKGPIRIDPQYRWHFIWEGTGEHYFSMNGTTAYWLTGWKEIELSERVSIACTG